MQTTTYSSQLIVPIQRRSPRQAAAAQWAAEHPAEAAWLSRSESQFADSLRFGLRNYGALTARQLEAIQRQLQREAEQARNPAPVVDVSAIERAFEAARASGLQRPKLQLGVFTFKPSKPGGKNPGALYVTRGGTYLGKITGGAFHRSMACSLEDQAAIVEAAASPASAAERHGRLTGHCSVCARPLTDADSLARGIGPVCAGRLGW
jgi:hypothetical protein